MKKKTPGDNTHAVPKAMQVQLARLFGSNSKAASAKTRTAAEWKKTLKSVLNEIRRYFSANVDTDELHRRMLLSGLAAADESMMEEDFWPGYAEGIYGLRLPSWEIIPTTGNGAQAEGRRMSITSSTGFAQDTGHKRPISG